MSRPTSRASSPRKVVVVTKPNEAPPRRIYQEIVGELDLVTLPSHSVRRAIPIPPQNGEAFKQVDLILLGPRRESARSILKRFSELVDAQRDVQTRLLWHDGQQILKFQLDGTLQPTTTVDTYRQVYLLWHGSDPQFGAREGAPPTTQTYKGREVPIPVVPLTQELIDPSSYGNKQLKATPGVVHNLIELKDGSRVRAPLTIDQVGDLPLAWFTTSPSANVSTIAYLDRTDKSFLFTQLLLISFFLLLFVLPFLFLYDQQLFQGRGLIRVLAFARDIRKNEKLQILSRQTQQLHAIVHAKIAAFYIRTLPLRQLFINRAGFAVAHFRKVQAAVDEHLAKLAAFLRSQFAGALIRLENSWIWKKLGLLVKETPIELSPVRSLIVSEANKLIVYEPWDPRAWLQTLKYVFEKLLQGLGLH